ncbi:hypothetical protein [Xenorhabdus bovienii]|uniref:EamA domain-containing protein n=1 Tax=Xenorhabdus bovienii str. Intermedium TaxID=1379677 RepID=A0A077QP67_XENBV|nr:hypothetical protein [Xenorhabdus bovienii]MDE9542921.1 hypothetical protein [Xenorhabdus bovienii]CDH35103.1 conserved membrane hypothetical protein [Xenorhabdus bovienii str. Intermedium]
MNIDQYSVFLLIIVLVTLRTIALKKIAEWVSPENTAFIIGAGTFLTCLFLLPATLTHGISTLSDFLTPIGIAAGLGKGVLLGMMLIAQQNIIGQSLSATTYVFPLALGGIATIDMVTFGTPLTIGGIFSISLLFTAGILFTTVGHFNKMKTQSKFMFLIMILCVIGFALMDRVGIPRSGWFTYLLFTGIGNMLVIFFYKRNAISSVPFHLWVIISFAWVAPELFFNYALATYLPVSYGYLAITLRIPLVMLISVLIYHEGKLSEQIIFSFIALIAILFMFVEKI